MVWEIRQSRGLSSIKARFDGIQNRKQPKNYVDHIEKEGLQKGGTK
jgi:hypothetical protein